MVVFCLVCVCINLRCPAVDETRWNEKNAFSTHQSSLITLTKTYATFCLWPRFEIKIKQYIPPGASNSSSTKHRWANWLPRKSSFEWFRCSASIMQYMKTEDWIQNGARKRYFCHFLFRLCVRVVWCFLFSFLCFFFLIIYYWLYWILVFVWKKARKKKAKKNVCG